MSIKNFKAMTSDSAKKSQRGFTLVELAIVLVIIGLIIAAVLKGQELIVSARLKSTISDIAAIRAAANTFRDKYNAIPGDYPQAQTRIGDPAGITFAAVGNGSGVLDGDGLTLETLGFWNELAAANMITGVSPIGAAVIGDGLPTAPVGGGLTIRNELVLGKTAHWVALGSGAATPIGSLTGEQVLIIDEKSDDGRPGSGSMRVDTLLCAVSGLAVAVDATMAYDITGVAVGCLPRFEL